MQFLVTAVSEAEHILEDIQSSLTEQKQLMNIFEQQQREVQVILLIDCFLFVLLLIQKLYPAGVA